MRQFDRSQRAAAVDVGLHLELSQHTGMVRFGDERRDRWAMSPAQGPAAQIAASILSI